MKIAVSVTVDIDPEAWEMNYGIPAEDKKAVRDDVNEYVRNTVIEQLREVGVLKS